MRLLLLPFQFPTRPLSPIKTLIPMCRFRFSSPIIRTWGTMALVLLPSYSCNPPLPPSVLNHVPERSPDEGIAPLGGLTNGKIQPEGGKRELRDELDRDEIFSFFYRKRFATFASFFLNSLVDVPACFEISTSLHRPQHNNFLYKLISVNLKRGHLERANSMISTVLFSLTWHGSPLLTPSNSCGSLPLLDILVPFLFATTAKIFDNSRIVEGGLVEGWEGDYPRLFLDADEMTQLQMSIGEGIASLPIQAWLKALDLGPQISTQFKEEDVDWHFRLCDKQRQEPTQWVLHLVKPPVMGFLLQWGQRLRTEGEAERANRLVARFETIFQQINPIFNFFSYKTSKTIWKFSRGKAGRYFFMWKYIPPYKRELLILRWLKHEFSLMPVKQSSTRFESGLSQFLSFNENHPFAKRKRFINHFIFREYRFSLMRHFRTRK